MDGSVCGRGREVVGVGESLIILDLNAYYLLNIKGKCGARSKIMKGFMHGIFKILCCSNTLNKYFWEI